MVNEKMLLLYDHWGSIDTAKGIFFSKKIIVINQPLQEIGNLHV